jgi:hypothetical protein
MLRAHVSIVDADSGLVMFRNNAAHPHSTMRPTRTYSTTGFPESTDVASVACGITRDVALLSIWSSTRNRASMIQVSIADMLNDQQRSAGP